MNKAFFTLGLALIMIFSTATYATCVRFNASTMHANGQREASWRTDYPKQATTVHAPWLKIDFEKNPVQYMKAVLEMVEKGFRRSNQDKRLVATDNSPWWISLWLDYTNSGREPLMGLTKERGPNPGDLSPNSSDGHQVWAVGFYNALGASVLGTIFEDACDPNFPMTLFFPEGTASVKFLFTDAPPEEVKYLNGAPEYEAFIDDKSVWRKGGLARDRVRRVMRLLQVDIATKDMDAATTNWVFGTFIWDGPKIDDGLFANLVPVSLQWGNDPGVYDDQISESWINPSLKGKVYGWSRRPHLGFNGRANGPADNIRSSCLSCHAAARIRRSDKGILGRSFDMQKDILKPGKVKAHVDTWFVNLRSGSFFDAASQQPEVAALDYSLQLDAAVWRMCMACREGDLSGTTPKICRKAGFYDEVACGKRKMMRLQYGGEAEAVVGSTFHDRGPPRQ